MSISHGNYYTYAFRNTRMRNYKMRFDFRVHQHVEVVRACVVTLRMCHVCACEERVQVCVRDECGRARGCAMAAAVAMPMGGDGGDW